MRFFLIILIFNIAIVLHQSYAHSKSERNENFNRKYLSNYFSALLSYYNRENKNGLEYFSLSKPIINKNTNFLKKYIFSLVENAQVEKAIKQLKFSEKTGSTNFYEAQILILIDNMKKKKFKKAEDNLLALKNFQYEESFELIIYKIIKSYNQLFLNNRVYEETENYGTLSLITSAFQNCYLNPKKSSIYFRELLDSSDGDYSRYLFFYISNLIDENQYIKAKNVSSDIDILQSGLLASQAKEWIDNSEFDKFKRYFSCSSHNDLLAEFFYLMSNLYSSQGELEQSNFYLNISNFLNPKFYFNLTLLAENYIENKNYNLAKKIYNEFDEKNKVYHWYKIKKIGNIIAKENTEEESIKFFEKEFFKLENSNVKILFDLANIYKRFKEYEKSIEYFTLVLSKLDKNSEAYASTLYNRGGSYERIKDYVNSDNDLLRSLEIKPEDPYVMNYLGYSWLERNKNLDKAIKMLNRAYQQRKDDPYIIDSVAWGYYLIGNYIKAEEFIKQAVQLMPNDPIVNDHYGDILWKLDRKLQAKYFWENVLKLEETEKDLKIKIRNKLIYGVKKK